MIVAELTNVVGRFPRNQGVRVRTSGSGEGPLSSSKIGSGNVLIGSLRSLDLPSGMVRKGSDSRRLEGCYSTLPIIVQRALACRGSAARHGRRETRRGKRRVQRAIQIARRQSAKSWELRAATSLARLWRDQGKHADARDRPAPVYAWFTEGFATPDLKEGESNARYLSE